MSGACWQGDTPERSCLPMTTCAVSSGSRRALPQCAETLLSAQGPLLNTVASHCLQGTAKCREQGQGFLERRAVWRSERWSPGCRNRAPGEDKTRRERTLGTLPRTRMSE